MCKCISVYLVGVNCELVVIYLQVKYLQATYLQVKYLQATYLQVTYLQATSYSGMCL